MTAVALVPIINNQQMDNSGNVLSGGLVYVYTHNTTTPITLYSDSTGTSTTTNPVTLNSSGRVPSGNVYAAQSLYGTFDIVIKTSAGVTLETHSNVKIGSSTEITYGGFDLTTYLGNQSTDTIKYTKSGSGTTRTITSKLEESVSVKDFGVVGNGITDDSTNIQNAINWCYSNNKSLYFPAGTYLINTALTISSKNGLKIYGEGSTSVIKYTTTSAIYATPSSANIIDNLSFDRNGVTVGNNAIRINGTDCIVSNCTFNPLVGTAIFIDGPLDGFKFNNNIVKCTEYGFNATTTSSIQYCNITNNYFTSCLKGAFVSNSSIYAKGLNISNNVFDTMGQTNYGYNGVLQLACIYNSTINNNQFINVAADSGAINTAVYMAGSSVYDGVTTQYSRNITISNNLFDSCLDGAIYIVGAGASYKTTNVNILNNTFTNNGTSIQLNNTYIDIVKISGNNEADTTTLVDVSTSTNITWVKERTYVRLVNNTTRTNVTGNSTEYVVPFNQVQLCDDTNLTGGYAQGSTSATGVYICQAPGVYQVDCALNFTGATTGANGVYINVKINGSIATSSGKSFNSGVNFCDTEVHTCYRLAKNDVLTIGAVVSGSGSNNWQVNGQSSGATQSYLSVTRVY